MPHQQMNGQRERGCIYTMYSIPSHLAIKMSEIMAFTATWMDLEMITLRQRQIYVES